MNSKQLKASSLLSRLALVALLLTVAFSCISVQAEGKIYKVLPHLLDLNGKHRNAPSLFERDAYQEFLRKNPDQVSGLGFDIHWKCPDSHKRDLLLTLEIRGSNNYQSAPFQKIIAVKGKKYFKTWSRIMLDREDLESIGKIVAWKATLVEADKGVLTEHLSFLWKTPPPRATRPEGESIIPPRDPGARRTFPR